MYVSISYYPTFITNLLILGHIKPTTAMIVIKCVNDDFKPKKKQ